MEKKGIGKRGRDIEVGRGGEGGEEHLMVNRAGECRKREDEGMEGLGEWNITEGIKMVSDGEKRVHEKRMLKGGRGGRSVESGRRVERGGQRVERWDRG